MKGIGEALRAGAKEVAKGLRKAGSKIDKAARTLDTAVSEAAGMPEGVKLGHAFNPDSDKHKAAMNFLKGNGAEYPEETVVAPAPTSEDAELEAALKLSLEAHSSAEAAGASSSEVAAPITAVEPSTVGRSEAPSLAAGDPTLSSQAQIHQPAAVPTEPVDLATAELVGHVDGYL